MADLTHRQVEARLKTFMEEHGWQKTGWYNSRNTNTNEDDKYKEPWKLIGKAANLHPTRKPHGSIGVLYPDAVFIKEQPTEDSPVIVAEVKPENIEKPEIMKGIGQCAIFLPFKRVKPYLVIPTKWYKELSLVFQELLWLGIITYDSEGKMQLTQRAKDRPN